MADKAHMADIADEHGGGRDVSIRIARRPRPSQQPSMRRRCRRKERHSASGVSAPRRGAREMASSWDVARCWIPPLQHGPQTSARQFRVNDAAILNGEVRSDRASLAREPRVVWCGALPGGDAIVAAGAGGTRIISPTEDLSGPQRAARVSRAMAERTQHQTNSQRRYFDGFIHRAASCGSRRTDLSAAKSLRGA